MAENAERRKVASMTIVERQFKDLADEYEHGCLSAENAERNFRAMVQMYDVRGSLRMRVEEYHIWPVSYSFPHHHR